MDFDGLFKKLDSTDSIQVRGKVRSIVGLSLRASVPGVRLGERVQVIKRGGPPLEAEVIGFDAEETLLLPIGSVEGVGPGDVVEATGQPFAIRCSEALLGRVVDGLGNPIDGGAEIIGDRWDIERTPPDPLTRPRIEEPLVLGMRAIDGLLTVGQGQRIGLFAGSGVGKSTLMGQIARQAEADVFVVCLIGERGREVREFLEDSLGESGRKKGVVVCATSDSPALVRMKSAHTATAIAEWFRDQGQRVLLLMDSVTRFARAAREVGLAAGEPPARRGYPPSVFARLPRLLERSGTSAKSSITGFYTVLVEGSDMEEPIADEVRGILDGHIVLARELGERGRWPAIDVLQSLSRVMNAVVDEAHLGLATSVREHLAAYEQKRDLISLGAYKRGSDPKVDAAIGRIDQIEGFLKQAQTETSTFAETRGALAKLV